MRCREDEPIVDEGPPAELAGSGGGRPDQGRQPGPFVGVGGTASHDFDLEPPGVDAAVSLDSWKATKYALAIERGYYEENPPSLHCVFVYKLGWSFKSFYRKNLL